MTSRSYGLKVLGLIFCTQLINLIGVVLPYFAKNEIADSPVLIVFKIELTDLSTKRAF